MPVLEELVPLLCAMIRIDSRNTLPLDAPGERIANEEDMGNFVTERLTALGFAVEKQYIAPLRPNVIGSYHAGALPTCSTPGHSRLRRYDYSAARPQSTLTRSRPRHQRQLCRHAKSLRAHDCRHRP